MSDLSLFLLGTPRLERDGQPVHLDRRKALALLAYLVLTGQSHGRDALATMFWPDSDQGQARANLRIALTALRQALGEGCLHVDRETVQLEPAQSIWVDALAFQARLESCRPERTCLSRIGGPRWPAAPLPTRPQAPWRHLSW